MNDLPFSAAPLPPAARPVLAPPVGFSGPAKKIVWNDQELRAGWRLLIFAMLFVALASAGLALDAVLHLPRLTPASMTISGLLVQECTLLIAALIAAWIMKTLEGRSFGAYGLPSAQILGRRFWTGAAWGLVMISATLLLISLFGGFSLGTLALRGDAMVGDAFFWGLAFVFVGLFEEFLFRGYAQFTLNTGVGFWPAATLLSASFGAVHLRNGGEGPVGALSVFVIAMFFCLTLRRTGTLWFAVGVHAAFDWGETFLFSVPDSGLVASGHLLNSFFHGSRWLTGGTIGPEGSVMVFLVVGAAAVIFSFVYPRREANRHSS